MMLSYICILIIIYHVDFFATEVENEKISQYADMYGDDHYFISTAHRRMGGGR